MSGTSCGQYLVQIRPLKGASVDETIYDSRKNIGAIEKEGNCDSIQTPMSANYSYNMNKFLDGQYQITYAIIDEAGNTTIRNIHLTLDTTPIAASSITFTITGNTIGFFSETETSNGNKIYTSLLDLQGYITLNGKRYTDTYYHQLVKSTSQIEPQLLQFVDETIVKQQSPQYFSVNVLTRDEIKPKKKEKSSDKPSVAHGMFNSMFGVKKKEPVKQIETVQNGEGQFVNPKSLKIHKGSSNPEKELENIVGLDNIKKDILKLKYMLEYEKSRKTRGIETNNKASLHMCFMGHPGTGKTTVARIMTGILYNLNYIKENKCVEINGLDLKGGYIGQSAIITKQIIDKAKGGILFIDEAYALCENKNNSFGKEAISVLLKEMEDNRDDLIVIFAGYEDDMNKFLNVNQGFRSRINKYFDFVDYTELELAQIFISMLRKIHLKINKDAFMKCINLFYEAKKHPNFSNGRFIRNLVEQIEEYHILNITDFNDDVRMDTILIEDIPDKLMDKMLYGM
jgi:AAA+ superfamily predicted ATPase